MAIHENNLVDLDESKNRIQEWLLGLQNFRPYTYYQQGFVIFHGNALWRARILFLSTDTFNPLNWERVAVNNAVWGEILGNIADQVDLKNILDDLQNQIDALLPEEIDNLLSVIETEIQARQDADTQLQDNIDAEAQTRAGADQSLQNAINAEAQTRQSADQSLSGDIQAVNDTVNAWIGRGGYLDAYDFGTASPTQQALTDYALSQISSISDQTQIWNGTKIVNLYNGNTWILTNTQDTDPPVFEWTDNGPGSIGVFGAGSGGYIVGAQSGDGPEYVVAQPGGKGKIDLDAIVELIFNKEHPVGDVIEQIPNALSPVDKGWGNAWTLGNAVTPNLKLWEICNQRAWGYRLRNTALPAYTTYTPGANYAVGAVVMWYLTGDDYGFFTANRAVTAAATQLEPVKWDQLKTGTVIEQRTLHAYTVADFTIGQQISGGTYNGYYVEEVLVYGGKYFAASGGNRPTYLSGGVAGDVSRKINGLFNSKFNADMVGFTDLECSGVFYVNTYGAYKYYTTSPGTYAGTGFLGLDTSRIVPVGPEASPRTISTRYWRRVA